MGRISDNQLTDELLQKIESGASIPLASATVDGKMSKEHYSKVEAIPSPIEIETVTGSQSKADAAKALANTYTDEAIAGLDIPNTKLTKYEYVLTATAEDQTVFTIPLETFDKTTDYILIVKNTTVLPSTDYTIEGRTLTLAEGVTDQSTIFIQIIKMIIIADGEANVSGSQIIDGTISLAKLAVEVATKAYVDSQLATKANSSDLSSHVDNSDIHVTAAKKTEWDGKSNFSGDYNDLSNKPTIPVVDVTKSYVDTGLAAKTNQTDFTAHENNGKHLLMKGTANFNSITGVTISHSIGSTNYVVDITPSQNANGYLGEYWTEKAANSFIVKCSGTATTSFDYMVF